MRIVHGLNLALYGALLVGSVAAWPRLPPRLPAHFDAAGRATRWSESLATTWFVPVVIAFACAGLLYAMPAALRRWPHLLNLPRRDEFVALPADRRGPVAPAACVLAMLAGFGAALDRAVRAG